MNEDPTKALQKTISGLNESGLEAPAQSKKAETPKDLLKYAEESKQSVDSSIKEVLLIGKELEVKKEGVTTDEAVTPEVQKMREIDQKAEAIGVVVNETINLVAKGQEISPIGDLLSKMREKILAIKTGVASKIDAFKEKRGQKAQEGLVKRENQKKLRLVRDSGRAFDLQCIVSSSSRERIDEYDVEGYSLASMELFSNNPYIFVSAESHRMYPGEFNSLFQEKNLKDCAEFYPRMKKISLHSYEFFLNKINKLPQWLQDELRKEQEKSPDKPIGASYGESIDFLAAFDEPKIAIFKKLRNEGAIIDLYRSGPFETISIFGDKIDLLDKEDLLHMNGTHEVDRVRGILNLSESETSIFKHIRQTMGVDFRASRCLEILDLLKQADKEGHNIQPLFDWAYTACDSPHSVEGFIRKEILTHENDMAENQRARMVNGAELHPEERLTLGFVCDRIRREEKFLPQIKDLAGPYCFAQPGSLSDFIDSFEKDPVSALVDSNYGNGAKEVFQHYENFKEFFTTRNISFSKEDQMRIYDRISPNTAFGGTTAFEPAEFPFDQDVKREIVYKLASEKPELCYENFNGFEQYLSVISNAEERQVILDKIFEGMKVNRPHAMLYKSEFPLTPEQSRFVSLMKRISESQSKELKNMGAEIASIVAKEESFEGAETVINKIEKVFLRNNIPFVGKQFKIFEILYPDQKLDSAAERSFVPSLKENHSNNSRRLTIFKDLLRANFDSLNVNLEQYLHILKDGQDVLLKSESGASLSPEENQKLLSFCKKINAMSETVGHESVDLSLVSDEQTIKTALDDLRSSFGVREGETIVQRFERTFLERIGIQSLDEALGVFDKKRQETDVRNREFAKSGNMTLEVTDLVKGFRSDYIDTVLDRGVFSPEFIGADTHEASRNAKTSDATPLDTDMILVGDRNLENIATTSVASGYGDLIMIMKDRGQFRDELELVNNIVVGPDQRGVRTGFGSTQIEGLIAKDSISPRRMEEIKFSIAKKGFYIPISNQGSEVIFSQDEFDKYRKIFAGVDRYHGEPIRIDSQWKNSAQAGKIEQYAQTDANIESIDVVRKHIFTDIQAALSEQGIVLNEGKYAESILGASISDTGSTGRGSALDEGYDFDFAVKLDDRDWEKVQNIVARLSQKYSFPDHYNQSGMEMYRSKDFELDGKNISLDIGFVKKSDVEAFDTNDAIAEKYAWIKNNLGEQAYLDAMTNIRFAKKTLKDAGCYKKGTDRSVGQQGGFGGIGVDHWVMQNDGNAVEAFRDFYKNAYQDGQPVSFEDFKKKYKIFSAGENIRNNMKAEDFMSNMDEEGYKKMAELSKQFV